LVPVLAEKKGNNLPRGALVRTMDDALLIGWGRASRSHSSVKYTTLCFMTLHALRLDLRGPPRRSLRGLGCSPFAARTRILYLAALQHPTMRASCPDKLHWTALHSAPSERASVAEDIRGALARASRDHHALQPAVPIHGSSSVTLRQLWRSLRERCGLLSTAVLPQLLSVRAA
jgi:hypothetical protein